MTHKVISLLKDKTTLFIILFSLSAPLFNLRIVASVTFFDVFTLFAILVFFSKRVSLKTILLLFIFILTFLISELNGLITMVNIEDKSWDSLNILFRYLILLFIMPYLSYRFFYSDYKSEANIDLFYNVLMCSFFGVLVFNIYAIHFELKDYFFLQRFSSIYGNANTAALVFNIMSVLYLLNTTHSSNFIRAISYASIFLTIPALIVTGSFSGYLIQAIIFSYFLIKTANIKVTMFLIFIVIIAIFNLNLNYADEDSQIMRGLLRFSSLVDIFSSSDSFQISKVGSFNERMLSIQMALMELGSGPGYIFSGIGFGNVETLVERLTGFRTSIHVTYLQLIISIGFIGTIVYVHVFLRVLSKIPRYLVNNKLIFQSTTLLLVFFFFGAFVPHTYMSFYFAPVFPLLGLYGVKGDY
jgi:hypothetical protein